MWEFPIVHYNPMIRFQRQQQSSSLRTIQYYAAPPGEYYFPVSLSGEDYYCHQALNPVPAAPSLSSTASSSFEKNEAPSFEPHISNNDGHGAPTKPKRQLFVFHLPEDMDDADLTELFSSCGEVSKSCVERDENGATRGYGFVTFRYAACAEEAIKQLGGYHVSIKTLFAELYFLRVISCIQIQVLNVEFEEVSASLLDGVSGANFIGEQLDFELETHRSRKVNFAVVKVVPIIKENGKYKRLINR